MTNSSASNRCKAWSENHSNLVMEQMTIARQSGTVKETVAKLAELLHRTEKGVSLHYDKMLAEQRSANNPTPKVKRAYKKAQVAEPINLDTASISVPTSSVSVPTSSVDLIKCNEAVKVLTELNQAELKSVLDFLYRKDYVSAIS